MRVAVPYDERFDRLPNKGFISLLDALCQHRVASSPLQFVKVHADELLGKLDFDAVFSIRLSGASVRHLENYRVQGVNLAAWHDDVHWFCWWRRPTDFLSLCAAADVVFLPYYRQFLQHRIYKPYHSKAVYLPWSVPDHVADTPARWAGRAERILLSGRISKQYRLRGSVEKFVKKTAPPDIATLPHPGYAACTHTFVGDEYYRLLRSHAAAIATSARPPMDYTVLKYFEIPACGCLAFMEPTQDLAELGFVDGLNCFFITAKDYERKFALLHSTEAQVIAERGRQLIRSQHTHSHRVRSIITALAERWV